MVGDKIDKKKIIIIYSTIELVNGNRAGSARVMNYARALSENCNVVLVTFKRPLNISNNYLDKIENGIFTVGKKSSNNKLIKKLFYAFSVLKFLIKINSLSKKLVNEKVKITFLLYPTTEVLIDFLTVLYFIKIRKYKVFYEVNEVRKYSSNLFTKPYNFFNLYQRIKYSISEKLTKYFAGLICISTNIEKYFKKYNANTLRIPILSNTNKENIIVKNKFKKGAVFKIGFFGSVSYKKENLELFLYSLDSFKNKSPTIKFIVEFYGPIDNYTEVMLKLKTKELNLSKNVFYKGKLKQYKVLTVMKNFHLLVLPRGNNLQNQYGFSTKLSEYLMSGIPCLVTDVSDNAIYIQDNYNGFIVPPDNLDAFVQKLEYIILHYNTFENIGNNAIKTVKEHFYHLNYSNDLFKFLC